MAFAPLHGIHFLVVQEPSPFSGTYFSHKFHDAALRSEFGACIKTGLFVWIKGPFPAGANPDFVIFRSKLKYRIDENELILTDDGYSNWKFLKVQNVSDQQRELFRRIRARH